MLYSYVTINLRSGGAMKNRQIAKEQIMGQVPETTENGATHMSFDWEFKPLPLDEAMGLARASRMDGAGYSMLREQFTLLVEDKIVSVRITPPPAVSYQKARHHCLKVAKNLAVAITVRRAPGGHIVCWKATAQEIETREKRGAALKSRRAEKVAEKGTSSSRGKRKSTTAQTTLA
jgi:hypothetical protein